MIDPETLRRVIRAALDEDLGHGDITSRAVVPRDTPARGSIVAREALVVAGLGVAGEVFKTVDSRIEFRPLCEEGELEGKGRLLATAAGEACSILAAERTALNFLQRMCGIATRTRLLVELAEGSRVQIADTRKTAPGLRALDKYAVRIGGGTNHRAGLYDAILIKDNHWRLAGGVGEAVRRARKALVSTGQPTWIEVEVGTLAEVEEALLSGADALLLDNMDHVTLAQAVAVARGRAFLEVSGGVRDEEIPRVIALGIDRISFGSLTHSVRASDIALELGSL